VLEFLVIAFIVTIVIIFAFIAGVKKTYKISKASCAQDYLDKQTIRYRQKSDTFIRSYVTKVRIQSNNSTGKKRF